MAFFNVVYGAQSGLCPTDEVICVQETGLRFKSQNPCGSLIFYLDGGLIIAVVT